MGMKPQLVFYPEGEPLNESNKAFADCAANSKLMRRPAFFLRQATDGKFYAITNMNLEQLYHLLLSMLEDLR